MKFLSVRWNREVDETRILGINSELSAAEQSLKANQEAAWYQTVSWCKMFTREGKVSFPSPWTFIWMCYEYGRVNA